MPAQERKHGLLKQLKERGKKALGTSRMAPPKDTRRELPPGIRQGVGQVREVKLGTYAEGTMFAGKLYGQIKFSVLLPEVFEGMKTSGIVHTMMYPLCDQEFEGSEPRSMEQNLDEFVNVLKLLDPTDALGLRDEDADPDYLFDNFDEVLEQLEAAKPYTYFSTRAYVSKREKAKAIAERRMPAPKTIIQIDGHCEYENPDPDDSVHDGTGGDKVPFDDGAGEAKPAAKPPVKAAPAKTPARPTAGVPAKVNRPAAPATNGRQPAKGDETGHDRDELLLAAEKATKGNAIAKKQLTKLAKEAGISQSDIDNATTWENVVGVILGERESVFDDEQDGREGSAWNVGDAVIYTEVGRRGVKTEHEVTVQEVNDDGTLTVVSLADADRSWEVSPEDLSAMPD